MSDTSYMVYDYPEPKEEPALPACPVCGYSCEYLYRKLFSGEILGCDNCIEKIDAEDEY